MRPLQDGEDVADEAGDAAVREVGGEEVEHLAGEDMGGAGPCKTVTRGR